MNPNSEQIKISIIAAMDEKRGIGKANNLLFRIPEDFARMKELTSGHPIIMGRKTFESIGHPLPNRTNIVVSRSLARRGLARLEGVLITHSLEEALGKAKEVLNQAQDDREKEVFIFGGGQIFEQAMPIVDKLYLTLVEGDYGADTFFPDYSAFTKKVFEKKGQSGEYKYTFLELEK